MAFFRWGPRFELGVPRVDEQHKQLVDLVNRMYEAMFQGEGRREVAAVLDDLVTYTVMHFKTEEELMDKHHFPGVAEHKAKHAAMTNKVLDLKKKVDEGNASVITSSVANFLKDWLEKHICGTDRQYADYLKMKNLV